MNKSRKYGWLNFLISNRAGQWNRVKKKNLRDKIYWWKVKVNDIKLSLFFKWNLFQRCKQQCIAMIGARLSESRLSLAMFGSDLYSEKLYWEKMTSWTEVACLLFGKNFSLGKVAVVDGTIISPAPHFNHQFRHERYERAKHFLC